VLGVRGLGKKKGGAREGGGGRGFFKWVWFVLWGKDFVGGGGKGRGKKGERGGGGAGRKKRLRRKGAEPGACAFAPRLPHGRGRREGAGGGDKVGLARAAGYEGASL